MLRPILIFCLVIVAAINAFCQKPAYEGFGAVTNGGNGLPVAHVTNLDATGPGSLHDAIGSFRTIVFDVAGTIKGFRWDSSEEKAVFNLTIDGSSAPAPGITLDNGGNGNCLSFQEGCHDIIVTNLRIRNAGNDGVNVVGGWNMVFDHLSISGSGDGNFDITNGAHDITVQYCLFGPGKPTWSGAMLIAYNPTRNISVHHNLFNTRAPKPAAPLRRGIAGERNPLVHSANNTSTPDLMADIRNNIIWNWGNIGQTPCCGYGYGTGVDHGGTVNIINNYYETTGTQAANAIDFNHENKNARGYVTGNISGNRNVNPNKPGNQPAEWPSAPVETQDACTAASKVLTEAGARPLDATDEMLIKEVSIKKGCPVK